VLARVDDTQIDTACEALARAKRISVHGCGREALQIKEFAMRLFHLGMPVSVVGDMTMPPLGKGDVFLVTAGPGELSTVAALMNTAKNAGAHNLLVTAEPESSAGHLAGSLLIISAQTMASDQGAAKTSCRWARSMRARCLFSLK
jgi:6-phospho-3-hexuloisomerase